VQSAAGLMIVDYSGHARVAQAVRTPIQSGENWWGPHDLRKAIDAGASDHMMPDVMKIGGVTGWRRPPSSSPSPSQVDRGRWRPAAR
jgi:hypothetical protein